MWKEIKNRIKKDMVYMITALKKNKASSVIFAPTECLKQMATRQEPRQGNLGLKQLPHILVNPAPASKEN